ncbi:MAG: sulfatase [Chloroflexi bacterium]|nr:sulfatase [Chloroflexota bacterium]
MNVIVICLDTLRADVINHLGASHMRTPTLDALARDGVWFDHAFAEALPTVPARRSMFTGMRGFPWRWVIDTTGSSPGAPQAPGWHAVPPHQLTLAERLVRAGYATGFMADTYHLFKPTMNFTRGFMSWHFARGQEADPYRLGTMAELPLAQFTRRTEDLSFVLCQWLWNVKDRKREEDFTFAQCIQNAIRFVDDSREMHPFFLWIDSFETHEPWHPPLEYADEYTGHTWTGLNPITPAQETDLTPDERERVKALYYGSVTFVDKWIGVLMNHLAARRLLDKTIVVLTSDHGTQLDEHGKFGKDNRHMNAYNTQVNMLVRHPEGPRDEVVSAFVQHIDLAPTILAWQGVSHEPLDGDNLWDLATGKRAGLRDWVLTVWGFEASVRDHTWNAVVNVQQPSPRWRLYRVDQDPNSFEDVAAANPEALRLQQQRLEDVLGAPLPARLPALQPNTGYPMNAFRAARARLGGDRIT